MRKNLSFYGTTLGKKIVMALSGLAMFLFLIGHMLGNLKYFGGYDATLQMYLIDHYALVLREIGQDFLGSHTFLWITRLGLIVAVTIHVLSAVQLRAINSRARPIGYEKTLYSSATVASRSMFWGGVVLLIFIVVHILHFTTGQLHTYGFSHGMVFSNVHAAFTHGYWVLFYVAGMLAVALHVFHGAWSMFQTLGLERPDANPALRGFATLFALILFFGFLAVPLAVFFGFGPLLK